jgi:hypothetical protein
LPAFVRQAGLWFSVADARPIGDDVVAAVRDGVTDAYGPWTAEP